MKRKLSVGLACLAGGLLVHLVLVACGSTGSDVSAQTAPCASWHVAGYYYSGSGFGQQSFPSNTVFGEQALPAGWEPMSATPFGNGSSSGALVAIRKCAQ